MLILNGNTLKIKLRISFYLLKWYQRKFKVYAAEKYDENHQVIPDSLTPKGYVKKIYVNPDVELTEKL